MRDGFEKVTMGHIAAEIGISVRTLHRHFPSKSDIVWGVIDSSFEALQQELERSDPGVSAVDAISEAVVAVFSHSADDAGTTRARIKLIATTPELQTVRSAAFLRWRTQIMEFLAARLGEPADGLVPAAAAAAVQAAIMEALAWWARENDPGSPRIAVARALRGIVVVGSI